MRLLPVCKALAFMADEVKAGMIDGELFKVFARAKAFEYKE